MNIITYFKARWAQYWIEETALRKRLAKIHTGRPYETSITTHMLFYVLSGCGFVCAVILGTFLVAAIVSLINAGLGWIAGLMVGV